MDFWEYLGGLLRIVVGACIALWAGTASFIAFNFSSDLNDLNPQNTEYSLLFTLFSVLFATPITALIVGKIVAFPMVLIIGWSEIVGKRDSVFYILSGAALGLLLIGYGISNDLPFTADLHRWLVVICSCIIGLLTYWLVAGKSAGRFRASHG